MRAFLIGLLLIVGLVIGLWFIRHQGKSQIEQNLAARERSLIELTKVNLSNLERIVLTFLSQEGRLPRSFEEVRQSRLLIGSAIDAWGREIRLETVGETGFRLISAGPDGQFGTEDDISRSH